MKNKGNESTWKYFLPQNLNEKQYKQEIAADKIAEFPVLINSKSKNSCKMSDYSFNKYLGNTPSNILSTENAAMNKQEAMNKD